MRRLIWVLKCCVVEQNNVRESVASGIMVNTEPIRRSIKAADEEMSCHSNDFNWKLKPWVLYLLQPSTEVQFKSPRLIL